MEYRLEVAGAPETIPGGTGILLLHPSTADTDRLDTEFLANDTDHFLVISTRTTADEVDEKLEFYGIEPAAAKIVDAISVERGYSRRESNRVEYLPGPDDIDGMLHAVERFLTEHHGKRKVSLDSVTELSFYASESLALEAVEALLELLGEYDAVGLFHLAVNVHDSEFVDEVRTHFDVVIEL